MAVHLDYNGFIAPLDPATAEYVDRFDKGYYGETVIFKWGGNYYLLKSGTIGGRQAGVDTSVSPAMFWAGVKKQYKLNNKGQWETVTTFTRGEYIAPADDVEIVYSSTTVYYLQLGDSGIWPSTYYAANAVPTVVTEGYPTPPTILNYGWNSNGDIATDVPVATDVTCPQITEEESQNWSLQLRLVCQAMVPDEGDISIEWYRDGELIETTEGNGVLTSKLIPAVDQLGAFVYHALVKHHVGNYSSWVNCDPLTLTVVEYDFDLYDPDAGEDTSGVLPPGILTPTGSGETVTPEARRGMFWKGFGALAGMYGGSVAVAGDTGGAAAASSGGGDLSKLFWLGGACGAALYGGGRFNT